MKFCTQCGSELQDGMKHCGNCGHEIKKEEKSAADDFINTVKGLNETADSTEQYDKDDIENNKILALFSYIGFLFIIPLVAAPKSKFARFHANQGLLLFIVTVAYGIVQGIITALFKLIGLGFIASFLGLVSLVFLAFMVLGIVNAVNGKAKELPIIGSYKLID